MIENPRGRLEVVVLATRVAAALIGGACIAYAVALAGEPRSASLFGGAAVVAVIGAVLSLRGWAVGGAMALISVTYCYAVLQADRGLDAGAPLIGLGLLLFGELVDLARAGGEGRVTEGDVWGRRAVFLLAISAGGAATAEFALLVGGSARGTGPTLLFFAAAAAVAALVVVLRLVRSLMSEPDGASSDRGR